MVVRLHPEGCTRPEADGIHAAHVTDENNEGAAFAPNHP